LLIAPAALRAGSITVTSPNGGEEWIADTTQTVTWTSTDLTGDVYVYLFDAGEYIAYLGTAPAAAESIEWLVCPSVGDGADYMVSVQGSDIDGWWTSDFSDATFSISGSDPRPQFYLSYPSGGETLTAGSSESITWTSTDPQGMVTIELYKAGQYYQYMGQVPMSDGYFDWPVCEYMEDASDWSIYLSYWDCGLSLSSYSGDFSVVGGIPQLRPSLTLSSMNGGETLQAGSSYDITWQAVNPDGYVNVSLYKGNSYVAYLGSAEMATESLTWNVCLSLDNSNDYWIQIYATDQCGADVSDSSEARFTIEGATPQPAPTIAVAGPTTGSLLEEGTTQAITWTSTNPSGTVYVWLHRYGQYLSYIGQAPMIDGTMNWYVCSPGGPGDGYAIAIYGYDECGRYVPSVVGGSFTITPGTTGTIQLTSPNGGETWTADSLETITWTTPNPTGTVNVVLVKGGTADRYLGSAAASAGLFEYDVCEFLAAGSDYRIRLEHYSACGTQTDTSDADFSIAGSISLALVSPNGGETLQAGATVPITWTAANAPAGSVVYVSLYRGGEWYSYLGSAQASAGLLNWSICPFIGDAGDYRVEIATYGCASLIDYSDSPFAIEGSGPPAEIAVQSPNGGEELTAGSWTTITWSATNLSGVVEIQLWAAGQYITTLSWENASTGMLDWYLCEYIGNGSQYTIEVVGWDGCGRQVSDGSDYEFTIVGSLPRPSFTITSPNGGESFPSGGEFTVTWDYVNPTGYVDIYISGSEGGESWIGSAWMSDGMWTGVLDTWLGWGDGYTVRLSWCECGDACVEDISDDTFTIFTPVPPDFNFDGHVDNEDYILFQACASGPGIPYAPGEPPPGCWLVPDGSGFLPADLDYDWDVDQDDFAAVQRCYSGEQLATDSGCVD